MIINRNFGSIYLIMMSRRLADIRFFGHFLNFGKLFGDGWLMNWKVKERGGMFVEDEV